MKSSFDLFAAILSETRAADASRVFVTELATLMKCDRVSLGLMNGAHIQLQAISHSSQFSKNISLVRAISAAMEEAVLQKSELVFPRQDGIKALVVRDHEELCRVQGGGAFLTMPLYWSGKYVGAVSYQKFFRRYRHLAGRCARQGDPGSFEAILSLEDRILPGEKNGVYEFVARRFLPAGSRLRCFMAEYAIESAQKKREQLHFRMRQQLLKQDIKSKRVKSFSRWEE
jgi:hypothetical protein